MKVEILCFVGTGNGWAIFGSVPFILLLHMGWDCSVTSEILKQAKAEFVHRRIMGSGEITASSTPYGGGVGGKFRKLTSRKPPSTPYARPVQRRWLSKLVDPAYRLISGGATLFLPSFVSKSLLSNSIPSSSIENHDKVEADDEDQDRDEDNDSGEEELCDKSPLPGFPGPSGEANRSEKSSDFNGHLKDRDNHSLAGIGRFDIEELIKGKTFSRDEVNHLVEIIQSRALEPSNKVEDQKFPPITIEKQAEQPAVANKILNTPHEEKQKDLDTAIWGNITPRLQSSATRKVNEVGASPAEIARAYMSNRKSETGLLSDKMAPNDERVLLHDDHKPFIPSFSPSSSTCWPGAMSENRRAYLTPRSQRGRFDLQIFPRTPYSRSIFSKSKSKLTQLQGDAQKSGNTSSPLWKQRTPAYDLMKSPHDPSDGATGSIGPIRRLRHKAAAVTHSRGSAYFYPTGQREAQVESSNSSKGTLLDAKKNLETGGPSIIPFVHSVGNNGSESSPTAIYPQSQVARTILEHISRNPPTPKEKNEELKRAIAWKKTPSSGVQSHSANPNEMNSFPSVFETREKVNQVDQTFPAQLSGKGKTIFTGLSKESVGRDFDAVNHNSSGMKFGLTNTGLKHWDSADLKVNNTSKEVPKTVPALGSEVGAQMKPSPSIGTKPTFPSITINKNESKWGFSSDSSSSGFTFPVSAASSGLLSEPPTPSILPSTTTGSSQHLSNSETAIPSYSFGLKKSTPALAFSFPSMTSDTIRNDASNIKFSFGSDDQTRLSFSKVGKDAVCY